MASPVPARDAATVLLLREGGAGLEVFLVKRNTVVDFMAGAHVFPGGKVDAADSEPDLVARLSGEREPSTAPELYIAAIRETFEEAGVLLSCDLGKEKLDEAREALARKESFASILQALDATLDAGLIAPWTRWVTPEVSPKRFDARFFVAAAPAEQLARHDDYETTESVWIEPARALEQVQRGAMMIAPATYKCLAVLATYRTIAEAFAAARAVPPRIWCPVVRAEAGRRLIILSDDPDHPDRYARMPGPTRMVFADGRFLPAEG
jgi:8-oxo-dGTP pyrophosphatase MutT (NUDIX family)